MFYFDGKVYFVDRIENFVNFVDLGFVLEIDGGVEVGDFCRCCEGIKYFGFNVVLERVDFCKRSIVEIC